ncbi:glycoside hydrolase family 3 N-terminal domain-containing protein [Desulforhabdus amnigena]|jgi:beta-N-acetylhexosaminidase|uniref:Glycoside hydrolase family 3 N-terminal domain-containing protein n=1 Tax=Desulforhabdus amnigena TaxID=40218 RepID=A0A9W6LA21_9BACT|nr:glycoside hydrolase family 3 N-terminal domain-containing protein [Desulforhabdus amnigena]NLJ28200.1 beta-N-acetylhexosaminidase [Deltaproteobacteria bacterium]GLI35715.1 hypothetical protein DAMNIGENAA_31480 [Desulforhabdus amnigena]
MTAKKRPWQETAGIHLMVGFHGTNMDEELKFIIRDFKIGGIVLFRRNIESPEQLRTLLTEAQSFAGETLGRSLLVSIDQEGGPVQRLEAPFTQLPSARDLALEGPEAIVHWTTRAADELRQTGIQINLAPVLDVFSGTPSHFMEARCLDSNPQKVAALGKIWIQTLQKNGVSATAKHFPGLGLAESDPHHFAPVIHWTDDASMQRDLLPFREAIRDGVHCVMTSHALYPYLDPDWPATLSPKINNEWLRGKLGFEGVLLSDDMDMAAVSQRYSWAETVFQGMASSIDFFLLCQQTENIAPFHQALSSALEGDTNLQDLHYRSLQRIERLLQRHVREC